MPGSRPREDLALEREHLAVVGLVVHARQVQCAVDDGRAQVLRLLRADHDVAELAWSRRGTALVDRKRKDIGRLVAATVLAVELANARGIDQLDRNVAFLDPRRGERQRAQPLGLLGYEAPGCAVQSDDVDVDQRWPYARLRLAGRSSGACFSECSP